MAFRRRALPWLAHGARIALGLVFLVAGVLKMIDPAEFAHQIVGYGIIGPELASLAAEVGKTGALARFSRDDEREADAFGVKYTIAAGYDPRGLLTFFEKLKKLEGGPQQGMEALLSTHPATGERIDRIDRMIERAGNPVGVTRRERFIEATAALRRAGGTGAGR